MPSSTDYSYPIGAFGRTLSERVAASTGITLARFDHRNRYNGYQTITFSGTPKQIADARREFDSAVSRHLRWRENQSDERRQNYQHTGVPTNTIPASEKYGSQGRYSALMVHETTSSVSPTTTPPVKLTKGQRRKQNIAAKKGVTFDATPSIIQHSKNNAWAERVEKQKKKDAEDHANREKDFQRYKEITGTGVVFLDHSDVKAFLDNYDKQVKQIDENHDDDR